MAPKLDAELQKGVSGAASGPSGHGTPVWYARFPSDCPYGDQIEVDDPCVYLDDEPAHAECAEREGAELRW